MIYNDVRRKTKEIKIGGIAIGGNNPIARADDGGEFWNVVVGAVIDGAINLVSSYLTAKVTGSEFTFADGVAAVATGALSGALTGSGLPVSTIGLINGGAAFVASVGADAFSGREIDYGKALMSTACAMASSAWGGNGMLNSNSDYGKALGIAKQASKVAQNTAKGQARKVANKIANSAWNYANKTYFSESMVQLGKAVVSMPASAVISSIWTPLMKGIFG